ncbi:MAG: hypothetical protein ABJP45_10975 [Cyclobacteriaceae bacterium]
MRKIFFALCLFFAGQVVLAQSAEVVQGDSIPWEIRKQSFIYNSANLFNDPQVAKMALYNLIAENPGNPALYDSLALIYLRFNQVASAALVSQQSLKINKNNLFATEIAASAFDNLGVKDRAIPYYETLYLAKNDLNVLYKIAFLQLELERHGEAMTSVDIIMNDESSKTQIIVFPTEDNQGQEVPLNVAAHRIKAMIEEAKGNEDEAKRLYLTTLEMYPGFQVVQGQLQQLNKPEDK